MRFVLASKLKRWVRPLLEPADITPPHSAKHQIDQRQGLAHVYKYTRNHLPTATECYWRRLSFVFYAMRDVHVRALDTPAAEHEAT